MKKLKSLKNLKNLKKLLHRPTSRRYASYIVAVLIGAALLIATQAVFGWANPPDRSNSDSDRIVMMLTSAIYDVNKPAVIDPHSRKVYLPDASIVLPPYPGSGMEIRYSYTGEGNSPKTMQVTTARAVQSGIAKVLGAQPSNDVKAAFAQVPNAQACSRGLLVTLNGPAQTIDDGSLVLSKKLHDGRQMNVYNQTGCQGYDFRPLVSYLEDAKSY